MADVTRVSEAELTRRESYIRENNRPRNPIDPFTWSYPSKTAAVSVGLGVFAANMHNTFFKKPWNHQLVPRLAVFAFLGVCGYALGSLRAHHYKTRDAIVEHYQELHSDEFVNVNDRYGRPYADVMLPWYPRRAQYRKAIVG